MKIVKIKGGLGNQLFQYSFAKLIQKKTGDEVKLDLSEYENLNDPVRSPRILKFNIDLPLATAGDRRKICKFDHSSKRGTFSYKAKIAAEAKLNKRYFFEKNRAYRDVDRLLRYDFFDGYWQSWRYVDDVWTDLKDQLTAKETLAADTNKEINQVRSENSVFVGIRRGDYLQVNPQHYGSFGQDYYKKAMEMVVELIPNPVFYIFSNDIAWVKKNMDFSSFTVRYRDKVLDDFDEFLVMANCHHAIIPNSTYHWWGARINWNEDKVVLAPDKWFQDDKPIDIVPPYWKRV